MYLTFCSNLSISALADVDSIEYCIFSFILYLISFSNVANFLFCSRIDSWKCVSTYRILKLIIDENLKIKPIKFLHAYNLQLLRALYWKRMFRLLRCIDNYKVFYYGSTTLFIRFNNLLYTCFSNNLENMWKLVISKFLYLLLPK